MDASLRERFRQESQGLVGLDLEVYQFHKRDLCEPVIGEGDRRARLCLFGRDPGREEVRHGKPFVGAGGQKVRTLLYERLWHAPMPDFEASLAAGRHVFWANTVPYKPLGNKAWSSKIVQRFQPLMAQLLLDDWDGEDVLTLGREAFFWFGLGENKPNLARLEAFWASEARFETALELDWRATGGLGRRLRIHPLPHPSPLNATWYKRFPELLRARLVGLGWDLNHWRLEGD